MLHEQHFHTGAVALNYAVLPTNKPPLVLLHGGSASWHSFAALMPELAARWHPYAVDLRGHGGFGRVPGHYRLLDYAADISAFLARGIGAKATLYGHSLGGIVALLVAANAPTHVDAVVVGFGTLVVEHKRIGNAHRTQAWFQPTRLTGRHLAWCRAAADPHRASAARRTTACTRA